MMKSVWLHFICIFFICFSFVTLAVALEEQLNDQTVSLEFHDEFVDNVLRQVALQGKYDLIYDEKFSRLKISGKYKNISVENALKRIYAGNSFTLTIDPIQRIIVVKTFGAKKYKIISGSKKGGLAAIYGISLKDVDLLHKEQVEEIEKYLSDPNSIDPLTGKSLGEIRQLHKRESKEVLTTPQDDQISRLHEKQKMEIEAYRSDPSSIDPITQMTLKDIKALHEKQYAEIIQENEAEVEPFTGMTVGEIRRLHKKQNEELNGLNAVDD